MAVPKNGIFVGVDDGTGYITPTQQADDPSPGDIVYFQDPEWASLPASTSGYVLHTNGPGSAPSWVDGASEHASFRQLIHFLDDGPGAGFASGAYQETLPAADPFPTSVIWWESSSKLKKIVELTITRNANQTPATEVWKMYDTDGSTVLVTLTDTISYSGIYETSRTRTWV